MSWGETQTNSLQMNSLQCEQTSWKRAILFQAETTHSFLSIVNLQYFLPDSLEWIFTRHVRRSDTFRDLFVKIDDFPWLLIQVSI